MCFNLFDFLLRRFTIWALGSFNSVPAPCTWRNWLLPGRCSDGAGGQSPAAAACAFAWEAGWENVFLLPFLSLLKPAPQEELAVCQNVPLYHGLAFLWPYSLWMKKGKVQVCSLSEPVHWIIHTKRFLLEEEQGGEGGVPQTGRSRNACRRGLGVALGREFPGVDEVWWQQGVP